MKVFIELQKLTDAPYSASDLHPFKFDSGVINDLVQDIKIGNPTCYLVTGYRGAGKSSFVRRVEHTIERESNIIFIHSSFAKYESHAYILRKLIRGLYQNLTDERNKEKYENLKKAEGNEEGPDERKISLMLPALYEKTFSDVVNFSRQKNIFETETKIEVDVLVLIALFIVLVTSMFGIIYPSRLDNIFLPVLAALASIFGIVKKVMTIKWTGKKTAAASAEFERKSLYDNEISDYHFNNILQSLVKKKFKIVFVLDELDKVEEKGFSALINEMKPYLVSGVASYIVVAGQEMFYKYQSSDAVDDAVLSTLFSRVIQVPMLSISDFRELFKQLVSAENTEQAADVVNYSGFIDYLLFKSKQVPRKFINLIRQKINWDDGRAYLDVDTGKDVYKLYTDMIRLIQRISDQQIAVNFGGGESDYLTMQLYIISERIFRNTGRNFVFSKADILKEINNVEPASSLKEHLVRYLDIYADTLLEELVDMKILKEEKIAEHPVTKFYHLIQASDESSDNIPEKVSADPSIIQGYYDFRSVLLIIFQDKKYDNDSVKSKVSVSEMVKRFERLGAFRTSTKNLMNISSEIDNADVLFVDEEIKESAAKKFKDNKINFLALTVDLLRFYFLEKLKESFPGISIKENRERDKLYDFAIESSNPAQPGIVLEIKYRKRNFSMKDAVSQASEVLWNVKEHLGTTNHFVTVLFNYEDNDGLERTRFRFGQFLANNPVGVEKNIHLLAVGISYMNEITEKIKNVIGPLLNSNVKTFMFQNQPLLTGHPDIDDHFYDQILNLREHTYEVLIAPDTSIKHWRFGIKFSRDGNFPPSSIRHSQKYPVFHLEKNIDSDALLVSYYNEVTDQELGIYTSIRNYTGEPVQIKLSSIGVYSVIDILDKYSRSVLEQPRTISDYHFCTLFAWADNRNEFNIEARITEM